MSLWLGERPVLTSGSSGSVGDLIVGGTLTVAGGTELQSLQTLGTQTILDTTTLATEDAIIDINRTGTAATTAGLRIITPSGSGTNRTILWDTAGGYLKAGVEGSEKRIVATGDALVTDTISESTANAGVTVDSVLLKDGRIVTADSSGATAQAGASYFGKGTGLGSDWIALAAGTADKTGDAVIMGTLSNKPTVAAANGAITAFKSLYVGANDAGSNVILQGIDVACDNTAGFRISSTAASSSTSTGALRVAGGVGVAGALNVGGTVTLSGYTIEGTNASGLEIKAPGYVEIKPTLANTGAVAGGTCSVEGGYAGSGTTGRGGDVVVSGGGTGNSARGGDAYIFGGQSTSGTHGNTYFGMDGYGYNYLRGLGIICSAAGGMNISATGASTSTTTGALTIGGGLGVAGAVNIGGTATAAEPTLSTHLATKNYVDTATAGGGDVTGPASSIDNALVRFNGTTGKVIQSVSSATLTDLGELNVQALSQNLDYTNTNVSATIDDYRFSGKLIKCGASAALASDITLTVPNATELNSQYPGSSFQTSVNWLNFIISNMDATYNVILAANTGVRLQGPNFTITPGTVAHFNAVRHDMGNDYNLWTVYRVDMGGAVATHAPGTLTGAANITGTLAATNTAWTQSGKLVNYSFNITGASYTSADLKSVITFTSLPVALHNAASANKMIGHALILGVQTSYTASVINTGSSTYNITWMTHPSSTDSAVDIHVSLTYLAA